MRTFKHSLVLLLSLLLVLTLLPFAEADTETPAPTAPPAIELPTEGDYVIRIDGGMVSEHTETVNGQECLRVDLFLDGVTEERLLSSISFKLVYDPALLTYVKYKSLSGSGTMNIFNGNVPGLSQYAFISTSGTLLSETTPLLTLWFKVADDAPVGSVIRFAFSEAIKADSISSGSYASQKRTVGAVLKPYFLSQLYGDANCDGRVTAVDASAALRHVVGISELSDFALTNANVDGNAELTSEDAAMILRYVVGLIDRFPVEP